MQNGDRIPRLIEIALSVVASVITSAVVVAWTISSTLSELRTKSDQNAVQLNAIGASIQALQGHDTIQSEQIARAEAHYDDIVRRLDSIDRKLDNPRR